MKLPANDDDRGPAVVQRVRTEWTKVSRGGTAAALRNAAPIAFPLPSTDVPLLHNVTMTELTAFAPDHAISAALPDRSDMELRMVEGRLRVRVSPSPWGMPRRHRRPPAVRLGPDEWVRWQINYRFGLDHGWVYRLETWNVALAPVSAETFLATPDYVVDELASLR